MLEPVLVVRVRQSNKDRVPSCLDLTLLRIWATAGNTPERRELSQFARPLYSDVFYLYVSDEGSSDLITDAVRIFKPMHGSMWLVLFAVIVLGGALHVYLEQDEWKAKASLHFTNASSHVSWQDRAKSGWKGMAHVMIQFFNSTYMWASA
jgi:hypothetical protein